jgi:hypothetical protein
VLFVDEGRGDRCVGNGVQPCWDGKATSDRCLAGRDRAPRTLFWKSKRRFSRAIGYPHWGMLDWVAPFRDAAAGPSMCSRAEVRPRGLARDGPLEIALSSE